MESGTRYAIQGVKLTPHRGEGNLAPALSPGQPTWAKGRDTEPRPGIETHPDKTQEVRR